MPHKFPVAEIFGPTIQGEGQEQGIPCHFVRFGGCDFRCEWCDTPHAVLPQAVKQSERLTTEEILERLETLHGSPNWVVISGGNPALHDALDLVRGLHRRGMKVAVETQGTRFKPWLREVDSLCVSPKPPSSKMVYTDKDLLRFCLNFPSLLARANRGEAFLKVVVFDHADYVFAKTIYKITRPFNLPFFVSAGNDSGKTVGNPSREDTRTNTQVREDLLNKARWLTNRVMVDPEMSGVRVQAQFHVALWGNELGR